MARSDVDLVGLDLAAEPRGRLRALDALAQLLGHALHIILVETQLAGDLAIRQIQPHEVEAQHPGTQWLMMTREDRPGQIVEPAPAVLTAILLALRLSGITPLLGDRRRTALHAAHPLGPAQPAQGLEALGIVDERLDVEHLTTPAAIQKGRIVPLGCLRPQHQAAQSSEHRFATGPVWNA